MNFSKKEKVFAMIHQLAREYWLYEMYFPISYLGFYFLEDWWLKKYAGISTITVSDSTRTDLVSLGFRKISLVPEGLNFKPLSDLPEKTSNPVIMFAGRLKATKRPDHAIKAFKIIKGKIPNAELWIFGGGPLKETLERTSGPGITFFGNLSNDERRALLRKGWVLLVPGLREGWGLNVTEANALGVPAVAYDAPGLRDSVRNCETGLLAEYNNVEDLASKTISVLRDYSFREKLSKNALNFSRDFDWDKTADAFLKLINNE
jgi:glycosyltransferase involved in cell wall biosynthesis